MSMRPFTCAASWAGCGLGGGIGDDDVDLLGSLLELRGPGGEFGH
jgi:hypothetical protein